MPSYVSVDKYFALNVAYAVPIGTCKKERTGVWILNFVSRMCQSIEFCIAHIEVGK